jgi:hypothetical protein
MNQNNIQSINSNEILTLLRNAGRDDKEYASLALSNLETLKEYFKNEVNSDITGVFIKYVKGETIVKHGQILSASLTQNPAFSYAHVPLGFILKGEVIVIKGEKATKQLSEADFIGLFETSDWLTTGQNREIGDWTLIANSETEILFFDSNTFQRKDAPAAILRDYLIEASRSDKVPQPLTTLPLLDWTASHTTRSRLSDYAIIAHTHLLPNNAPLFRHLAHLVGFGRMYILEKPYSTVPKVRNELIKSGCEIIPVRMEPGMPYEFAVQKSLEILWAKILEEQRRTGFKKILIIDDGGDIWLSTPWDQLGDVNITGVEQTQRGITRVANTSHRIPSIVSVASSGIKKFVESKFIGRSIVEKLQQLDLPGSHSVGILGTGSIGSAVRDWFRKNDIKTLHYDPTLQNNMSGDYTSRPSLDSLINDSDVIIGTTGTDALKGAAFERMNGNKILVSASSADIEFSTVLKFANPTDAPFGTRHIEIHDNLSFDVLNGGYPINFDRQSDATPDEDIVLTRCLMYVGAMEAVELLEKGSPQNKIYALDPTSQKKILNRWIEKQIANAGNSAVEINEVESIVNQQSGTAEPAISVWQE